MKPVFIHRPVSIVQAIQILSRHQTEAARSRQEAPTC